MRKTLLLLILSTLFVSVAIAQENVPTYGLRVTLINQEPDPAQPGQYVDIRLKVENIASDSIDEAYIEFLPEFPFSLDSTEEALIRLGDLGARAWDDNGITAKYKVRVDDKAVQGENTLRIRYRTDGGSWVTKEFDIDVKLSDATLGVKSVKTENEVLTPGSTEEITLTVQNLAASNFRDITVKLDLALESLQISTTSALNSLDTIPLAPQSSATEKKTAFIRSGEELQFTYDLKVYPNAATGVYKIPVEITFFDELGTEFTKNDFIGVVIGSEPSIDTVLDEVGLEKENDEGEVTIRFVNNGIADVKFLNVELNPTDQYELQSAEKFYIGNVESDDYETADFTIKASQGGEISIPITYTYKDDLNKEYTREETFTFTILTSQEAEEQGVGRSGTPWVPIIVVLVILIVIVFFWRRRK